MELISSVPGTCSPGVSDLHNSSCFKGLPEKPEWKKIIEKIEMWLILLRHTQTNELWNQLWPAE